MPRKGFWINSAELSQGRIVREDPGGLKWCQTLGQIINNYKISCTLREDEPASYYMLCYPGNTLHFVF